MQSITKKSSSTTSKPKKLVRHPEKNVTKHQEQATYWKVPLCVKHYFRALTDPFTTEAGACMPCDLFPLPSAKLKTFVRGRFVLGTSGVGFIGAAPVLANDAFCAAMTTSTSALTQGAALNSATFQSSAMMTQLPYSTANLSGTQTIHGRIVGAGLRVKYVGSLMNTNGVVVSYEDPDHMDALRLSYDQISSSTSTSLKRVGTDYWDHTVNLSGPVMPGELDFVNSPWTNTNSFRPYLCLAIVGTAGDSFEYEFYQHAEFIGAIVPNKTVSHADAQAFAKVSEAVKSSTASTPLEPREAPSLWRSFLEGMSETLPSLIQIGRGVATSLVTESAMGLPDIIAGGSGLLGLGNKLDVRQPQDNRHKFMAEQARQRATLPAIGWK